MLLFSRHTLKLNDSWAYGCKTVEYLYVIPQQWQCHYNAYDTRLSTLCVLYYEIVTNAHPLPHGSTHQRPHLALFIFLLTTGGSTRELTYLPQKSLLITFTLVGFVYALESTVPTPTYVEFLNVIITSFIMHYSHQYHIP